MNGREHRPGGFLWDPLRQGGGGGHLWGSLCFPFPSTATLVGLSRPLPGGPATRRRRGARRGWCRAAPRGGSGRGGGGTTIPVRAATKLVPVRALEGATAFSRTATSPVDDAGAIVALSISNGRGPFLGASLRAPPWEGGLSFHGSPRWANLASLLDRGDQGGRRRRRNATRYRPLCRQLPPSALPLPCPLPPPPPPPHAPLPILCYGGDGGRWTRFPCGRTAIVPEPPFRSTREGEGGPGLRARPVHTRVEKANGRGAVSSHVCTVPCSNALGVTPRSRVRAPRQLCCAKPSGGEALSREE